METRSKAHVEGTHTPQEGRSYKEAVTTPPEAHIEARAGAPRPTPAAPHWRIGQLHLSSARLFTILGLAHTALAAALVFGCRAATVAAFGKAADPPEDQHCHLLHLYASGLATSAATAYALKELAQRNMMQSCTADVLNSGLFAHGIAWLALFLQQPATLTPLGYVVEGLAALVTASLPASYILTTNADRRRVWGDIKRMPSAVRASWSRRQPGGRFSTLSLVYATLALNFVLAGVAYVFMPHRTLLHTFGYDYGKSAQMLWKAIGGGLLMTVLPAVTVALKHKADTDNLATGPGRALNLGLLATAVGHLLVLGPIAAKFHGGFMLPFILATWAIAMLASMAGLGAASAVAELAEEVTSEAAKAD